MFNLYSPYSESGFVEWKQKLSILQESTISIRQAVPNEDDGRCMRWIQADCESTTIRSVEDNISRIRKQHVILAEFDGVPGGFCCMLPSRLDSDVLFIQLIAVVPSVRRQGAGMALLSAAADCHPERNLAMAVLDDNGGAQRLNERFAQLVSGNLKRVPLRRFRRSDLGFAEDERHRPWIIERRPPQN